MAEGDRGRGPRDNRFVLPMGGPEFYRLPLESGLIERCEILRRGGRAMHIFFSVGEPSGDQHAAHLIHALERRRPDLGA